MVTMWRRDHATTTLQGYTLCLGNFIKKINRYILFQYCPRDHETTTLQVGGGEGYSQSNFCPQLNAHIVVKIAKFNFFFFLTPLLGSLYPYPNLEKRNNKLGLSCAKLMPPTQWACYPIWPLCYLNAKQTFLCGVVAPSNWN